MTNMTLAVPEDLHKIMRKHNEVKWSTIARQALWNHAKRLEDLDELDAVLANSKLTEQDVRELDRKIKEGIARKIRQSSSIRTGSSPPFSATAPRDG